MAKRWTVTQTRLLADVGALLVSLDGIEALQQVARHIVPLLGDLCAIVIRDERQQVRRVALAYADTRFQPLVEHLIQHSLLIDPHSIPARVLDSSQPLLLADLSDEYYDDPAFSPLYRDILHQIRPRHILGVPMRGHGMTCGALVLTITDTSSRRFTSNDIDLICELARRIAMAVENILLHRSTQRRLEQLLMVQRVAALINSTLQTDLICRLVVKQLHDVFGYQLVSMYLLQNGALHLQAVVGYDRLLPVIQLHEGVAGRVIRNGGAEFVRDAQHDPDFLEVMPDTKQCIAVPLRYETAEPVGVIIVESQGNPALDDEDFFLLSLLADQIGVAFFNSLLFERLRDTNERFRLLIELAGNLVICLDPDLRITEFNRMAAQVLARAREDVIGRPFATTLLSEAERPLFAALVREVITGQGDRSFETSFWVDGRKCYVLWTVTCRRQTNGTIGELLLVGQDLTDQREKTWALVRDEQRLQALERFESMAIMAGGIAHDFNNLLSMVVAHANALQTIYPTGSPADQHIHHLIEAAHQAGDLVRELLSFATGRQTALQPVDLNHLIQETVSLLQSSLGPHVHIRIGLEPSLPAVLADPVHIRQVLMNLVINAAEAFPDQRGEIWVQTGLCVVTARMQSRLIRQHHLLPGQYAILEVRDNGEGIDPAICQRIFEPFFTTKSHGHGLGLASVLHIVQRYGGGLEVDSQPGQGSTFTVWLPVMSSVTTEMLPVPSPTKEESYILVIDDNPEVRALIERILVRAGYRVLVFHNGNDAIRAISDHPVVCALIDMTLADMHGYEVCRQIAAMHPHIPLALVSGYAVQAENLVDVPVMATLQKPFRASELLALVRRLIENPVHKETSPLT